MHIPQEMPQESCTPVQIAAWIEATQRKRLDLQLLFAEPLYNTLRDQAFLQMTDLVKEAIEEVRVLSATLQDDSQALRARAQRLREQSTVLCDRSARARAQRCPDGPSPAEIRAAEQPMLAMFSNGRICAGEAPPEPQEHPQSPPPSP